MQISVKHGWLREHVGNGFITPGDAGRHDAPRSYFFFAESMTEAIRAFFIIKMVQAGQATLRKLHRISKFRFYQIIIALFVIIKFGPNPSESSCINILVVITLTSTIQTGSLYISTRIFVFLCMNYMFHAFSSFLPP